MRFLKLSYWASVRRRLWIWVAGQADIVVGDVAINDPSRRALERETLARLRSVTGVDVQSLDVWTESETACKKHDYRKVKLKVDEGVARAMTDGYSVTDYVCAGCTHGMRRMEKGGRDRQRR